MGLGGRAGPAHEGKPPVPLLKEAPKLRGNIKNVLASKCIRVTRKQASQASGALQGPVLAAMSVAAHAPSVAVYRTPGQSPVDSLPFLRARLLISAGSLSPVIFRPLGDDLAPPGSVARDCACGQQRSINLGALSPFVHHTRHIPAAIVR
ncbi:hypothetical protein HYDPIDRAFT_115691 [Hydnomerulius pinastri MD-312]|uniref:Uncharacterized protein n=1 Tax=Hydnomerulius pinastri MD-312 TaxID=994086 RepID=A0A0C9WBV7_9AGAM|nr:hypothetical protein HYDPIDRAFT_115691 [Hydnomerulius pinastri MD-312]